MAETRRVDTVGRKSLLLNHRISGTEAHTVMHASPTNILNKEFMNARDLRIGNIVFDKSRSEHDFEKLGNGIYGVSSHAIERFDAGFMDLKPVPLTSEWLERFSFEDITKEWQTDKCFRILSKAGTKIDYWLSEQAVYRNEDHFLTHVHYVHQLQNLYFALTGSELQLKY